MAMLSAILLMLRCHYAMATCYIRTPLRLLERRCRRAPLPATLTRYCLRHIRYVTYGHWSLRHVSRYTDTHSATDTLPQYVTIRHTLRYRHMPPGGGGGHAEERHYTLLIHIAGYLYHTSLHIGHCHGHRIRQYCCHWE